MSKIFISGASGSGKTTYAKKMAKKLSLPLFDLDDIKYEHKYLKKRSEKDREIAVKTIIENNKEWIVEGVYFREWIEPFIIEADEIIIIKISPIKSVYRILFRGIKRFLKIEQGGQIHSIKGLLEFIHFAFTYNHKFLPVLLSRIEKCGKNYTVIKG